MASDLLLLGGIALLILGLLVVVIIGAIYFWRKKKAVILSIEKDYRNPQAGWTVFYAIYSKQLKYYELFTNALSFKPVRGLANVDLKAYTDNFGRVRAVRGVSGKPGDDMIVPVGLALNSQASANEYAQMMSDGISARFQHIGLVYQKIKGIDLDNIEKKELKTLIQTTGLNLDSLKTIQQMKQEDVSKLSDQDMDKFLKASFTPEWVMQKLGIRRVEDANIITVPQKNAIASLNTRANEFIVDHSGWWDKHGGMFIGIMCIMIVSIGIVMIMYENGQVLAQLPGIVQQTVQSSTTGALNAYGINVSNLIPKVS